MKIVKKYSFTNDRQLWRILISESGKLIIEDRDIENKLAFFSCLQAETGREIFRNLQMEEEFWIGIEEIYKDIIYFHKYAKPDMPQHKEIIAWDINTQKILWHNHHTAWLFAHNDKIYAFRPKFEGRHYFSFNYLTGEELEDLGMDSTLVNSIRNSVNEEEKFRGYLFPEVFYSETINDIDTKNLIRELSDVPELTGNIEFTRYRDLLFFNYYSRNKDRKLTNRFTAADIVRKKVLFTEVINSAANAYVPDSFFMKDNLLFVLKEKKELLVYSAE